MKKLKVVYQALCNRIRNLYVGLVSGFYTPGNADEIREETYELIKSMSQNTCAFTKHPTKKVVQDFTKLQEMFIVEHIPKPIMSIHRIYYFQKCFKDIINRQGLLTDFSITQNKAEQEILLCILNLFSKNILGDDEPVFMETLEIKTLFVQYSQQYHLIRKEMKKNFKIKPTRKEMKQFIDINFQIKED